MRLAGQLRDALVDVLAPPTCPVCRRLVVEAGTLCAACWPEVAHLDQPVCDRLGVPLAWGGPGGQVSAEGTLAPPAWDRARAAVLYGPCARRLVSRLKYFDRTDGARAMGRMMARAGADLLEGGPLVAPVPLHRRRFLSRRYNQAALLAGHAVETWRTARAFDRAAAAERARWPDVPWLPLAHARDDPWPEPDAAVVGRDEDAGPRDRPEPTGGGGPVRAAAAGMPGADRPPAADEPSEGPDPPATPEFVPDLLVRTRATRSQVGLDPMDRASNVKKAFAVRVPDLVAGRRVVLVDDVLTTGATATAATAALRRAGASGVDVLVFARVVTGPAEPV